MRRILPLAAAFLALSSVAAAAAPLPDEPRSERARPGPATEPVETMVAPGYELRLLAGGLDLPSSLAFDAASVWVAERGAEGVSPPRLKRIDARGEVDVILSPDDLPEGRLLAPLTAVRHHRGYLWIAHRALGANGWPVGAVSRLEPSDPAGTFTTVLTNLPSAGDHPTQDLVFGRDGRIYFAQGTATSTGVVGPDADTLSGWLRGSPTVHDVSPKDVRLGGSFHVTQNPLDRPGALAITSPMRPFASGLSEPGRLVEGARPDRPQSGMVAGNGAVYSFVPYARDAAATLRLEAWGLRDPRGLAVDPFHARRILVTNRGAAMRLERGGIEPHSLEARPISGDRDDLLAVTGKGSEAFFGWPDFIHDPETGEPVLVSDPRTCEPVGEPPRCPEPVLDAATRAALEVRPAQAGFDPAGSVGKLDFATDARFGAVGDLFVAQSGAASFEPSAERRRVARVVRIDRKTGTRVDFLDNTGESDAEMNDPAALNRPVDVKFWGRAMFVADEGPHEGAAAAGAGKVWVVTRARGARAARPPR